MPASTGSLIAQYVRRESILHRVDALSKLFAVFLISANAMFTSSNLQLLLIFSGIALAALILGRVPLRTFIRGFTIFFLFGLGIASTQLIFNHTGTTVFQVLGRPVTSGGAYYGMQKGLTILIMALASFTYIWTTNPRETVVGLTHLGVPYRFAWGIFLVLRYIPLFENEFKVIREAQRIRGINEKAGIAGRLEMYKRYTLPLLVSMVRKTTNIAIAMDGRAFGAYPTRTFRDQFRWSWTGMALVTVLILLLAANFAFGNPFAPKNPVNLLG